MSVACFASNPLIGGKTSSIDQNTNRFNPGQGYSYDKAGNITTDVDEYGNVRLITFNGDNKQTFYIDH